MFERKKCVRFQLIHTLLFFQNEIKTRCPELLDLGLLSEVGLSKAGVKEQKRFVSFHHKTLQENSASRHVVKKLEKSTDIKVSYKNHPCLTTWSWGR